MQAVIYGEVEKAPISLQKEYLTGHDNHENAKTNSKQNCRPDLSRFSQSIKISIFIAW